MSSIGHNHPPREESLTPAKKVERILSLLDRQDLTSAQKCVGVKIIGEADRDGVAKVRTPELQRAASARDRETVFRATKALGAAGIEKASGLGQAGRYTVLPERVISAVIEAYEQNKTGRHEPDQSTQKRSGQTGRDENYNPVGMIPTGPSEPVGLNGTGRDEPVGMNQTGRDEPDQSKSRACTRIETPSGLLPYEDNNRNIRAISEATLPGFEEKPMPTNPRALGTSPRQSRSISETDIAFEKFWSLFPAERRRGKGKARGLFAAIVAGRHKIGRASADEMVQAVREWRGIDPNFPPMPETWLNQGRWMDDPKRSAPNHMNGSRSDLNGHIHEEVDYDALRRESGIVVYRGRDG